VLNQETDTAYNKTVHQLKQYYNFDKFVTAFIILNFCVNPSLVCSSGP